eukprot:sb/3470055/
MATGMLKLCAHNVFYEGALSRRYRLTNDHFDVHLQLIIETSAPIGCAPSKGFLKTHAASPGGSFRPFQRDDNNTVAMATELVTMVTGIFKVIRKYQQTPLKVQSDPDLGTPRFRAGFFPPKIFLGNFFVKIKIRWGSRIGSFRTGAPIRHGITHRFVSNPLIRQDIHFLLSQKLMKLVGGKGGPLTPFAAAGYHHEISFSPLVSHAQFLIFRA